LIADADDRRGCPAVAPLSYAFWQDHSGGEQNAIGGIVSLSNHARQVIGVASPGFSGVDVGNTFDVAVPICAASIFDGERSRLDKRSWWWLKVMGGRKAGVSPTELKARLAVLAPQIHAAALPLD
jgi:putative ABC transport system permease protein